MKHYGYNQNSCDQAAPMRRRSRRRGMTLVELLITLTITALLLTATSVALDAGLYSYQANQEMQEAGLSVRNAVHQMRATIATAWNDPDVDVIDVNLAGDRCSLTNADGQDIVYRYNRSTEAIEMNIDSGAQWYALLHGVEPLTAGEPVFVARAPKDSKVKAGTTGRVEIRFRMVRGDESYPVSVSVTPRNLVY